MKITREDLHQIGDLFFHETPEERVDQCSRMTSIMEMELEDRGVECEVIHGQISYNGSSVGHTYIKIPADQFIDITSGPVILDVSVHQFGNRQSDEKPYLGQDFTLPTTEEIGIYTPEDDMYKLYS